MTSAPAGRLVGASVKRREDGRLVVGRGRYLDDLIVPGVLHLAIVRSPHAHARVRGVARDDARGADGVVAVLTLDDLPECAGSVPPTDVPPRLPRHPACTRGAPAARAIATVVTAVSGP